MIGSEVREKKRSFTGQMNPKIKAKRACCFILFDLSSPPPPYSFSFSAALSSYICRLFPAVEHNLS